MSNRVFKGDLSTEGINRIIEQLEHYAKISLPEIADTIVRRLAQEGIRVAEYSVYADWRELIEFRYEPLGEGEGELIGENITLIHRVWYASKEASIRNRREAFVSPILMSEYGAGPYAQSDHRGTFPAQRHAFEEEWFWYDATGTKHSSEEDYHMVATQPMFRAMVEMMQKAREVVKEVFMSYGG